MIETQTPAVTTERANTFPWPPVLFVAAFACAWLLTHFLPLPWPGLDDLAARVVGLGFGVLGLALVLWAAWTLSRHGTTIMPDRASTVLVTSGPFALLRNPFYLGEVLILLSLAEISKSIWYVAAAAVFALLVTSLQILPEERHLEARFGEAYRAYKARSRRWI